MNPKMPFDLGPGLIGGPPTRKRPESIVRDKTPPPAPMPRAQNYLAGNKRKA